MRTTIDLPDSLYRELKVLAAKRGVPLKEVIQSLVESALYEPAGQTVSEALGSNQEFPSISIGGPYPKNLTSNAAFFEFLGNTL